MEINKFGKLEYQSLPIDNNLTKNKKTKEGKTTQASALNALELQGRAQLSMSFKGTISISEDDTYTPIPYSEKEQIIF